MKTITKKILSLSLLSSFFLLNGCSSPQVISISNTYTSPNSESYYGIVEDLEADARIEAEILAQNNPTEIEIPFSDDPTITTELIFDPEAFTAENYVQAPPVITYKYMDDPNFYEENELPKNKFRLGSR